jgi:hypothetical protein
MKCAGFLLSLSFLLTATAFTQKITAINEDKYRINLPDYWKPGNKVWQILTDKLPQVCEELKDKDLCGDNCNPKYTIEFEMSEPYIYDYRANTISSGTPTSSYNFVTTYSFECSLLLFDEKDKLITKIILVGSDENWTVTHRAELRSFVPAVAPSRLRLGPYPTSQTMASAINQQAQSYMSTAGATQGETPYSYIKDHVENLFPAQKDMLMVVDNKIRNL